jgi:hypothetical protein
MQSVWARILAGEANQSGSFSKKTIETLSVLEKKDAELLTSLCSFGWSFGNRLIPLYCETKAPFYAAKGVTFDSMNHFAALGLVSFNGTMFYHFVSMPPIVLLQYFDENFIGKFSTPPEHKLEVGLVMLTPVGTQLAQICGPSPVPGFVDYSKAWWAKKGLNLFSPAEFQP